jgi:hypothetical protein
MTRLDYVRVLPATTTLGLHVIEIYRVYQNKFKDFPNIWVLSVMLQYGLTQQTIFCTFDLFLWALTATVVTLCKRRSLHFILLIQPVDRLQTPLNELTSLKILYSTSCSINRVTTTGSTTSDYTADRLQLHYVIWYMYKEYVIWSRGAITAMRLTKCRKDYKKWNTHYYICWGISPMTIWVGTTCTCANLNAFHFERSSPTSWVIKLFVSYFTWNSTNSKMSFIIFARFGSWISMLTIWMYAFIINVYISSNLWNIYVTKL